jgi:hypothetical protein
LVSVPHLLFSYKLSSSLLYIRNVVYYIEALHYIGMGGGGR